MMALSLVCLYCIHRVRHVEELNDLALALRIWTRHSILPR